MINLSKQTEVTEKEESKIDWEQLVLTVLITGMIVSLFTFCLTEYNIQLDCKVVGGFRIEGAGFKCEPQGESK